MNKRFIDGQNKMKRLEKRDTRNSMYSTIMAKSELSVKVVLGKKETDVSEDLI